MHHEQSFIVPRSLWLLKKDRTRLDAFQCSCLRQILRIAPSFISRVSNVDVLVSARQIEYSSSLRNRQVRLFKKIQSMPIDSMLHQLVCKSNGEPKTWHTHRNRGRPRQRWAESVYKFVLQEGENPSRLVVPFFHPNTESWW